MNVGKCSKCAKTVYQIEAVTAGPPGKTQVFHKGCFKCATCGWQLTLTNYKFWEDQAYCKNHYPVTGFGDQNAKHVSGKIDTNSQHIEPQLNAPKVDTVNTNVRVKGEKYGPTTTTDSIHIATALNAPRLNTVNQNLRGAQQ